MLHPGYAPGVTLAVVGIGLVFGNWLSLAVLILAVTAGVVYRIRVDERAPVHDLGDRYRQYSSARRRPVPFVW